jgi:hypothetical protein
MPLLNINTYEKKKPWRDATVLIVICEGSNKEPDYFGFFNELTKKIRLVAVPSEDGKSSPNHLIANAKKALEKHSSHGTCELWFVIDVDKWLEHKHIYKLQKECSEQGWKVVISNPCFEVWLNNHFSKKQPSKNKEKCKSWKIHVHKEYGGFDHTKHPTLLLKAIEISKENFSKNGYIPDVGSTQIYLLGERIYGLTEKLLKKYQV